MTARPAVARAGIAALNLLQPGLGLVRLGHGRAGVLWILAFYGLLAGLVTVMALAPTPSFTVFAAVAVAAIIASLGWLIAAVVVTWRRGGVRSGNAPWWTRWYALVALYVMCLAATEVAIGAAQRSYRNLYAVSESMAPTLLVGDYFVVARRASNVLRRGDVVVVARSGGPEHVWRVIGFPGDRVALRGGVPVIGGEVARQRRRGRVDVKGFDGNSVAAPVLIETLPGAAGVHEVAELGPTRFDDLPEQHVPAGRVFVLGDNRDNSLDSRFDAALGGPGMVAIADIVGRPLFIYWSQDRTRIGTVLTHGDGAPARGVEPTRRSR